MLELVGSPKLLMLSGLGDADELSAFGIPVLAHIPGVGKNLQNHIGMRMLYEVDTRTLNPRLLTVEGSKARFGFRPPG